jgi:hypothetical protein
MNGLQLRQLLWPKTIPNEPNEEFRLRHQFLTHARLGETGRSFEKRSLGGWIEGSNFDWVAGLKDTTGFFLIDPMSLLVDCHAVKIAIKTLLDRKLLPAVGRLEPTPVHLELFAMKVG